MAKTLTPQEFVDKWQRRTSAATEDMRRGVMAVTTNPMQVAAQHKQKMLQKVTDAINSGKWEAGLNRVTLPQWQQAMSDKGIGRVSAGVQSAGPKMQTFATQFLPYAAQVSQQIKAMPGVTLEDGKARALKAIDLMAAFPKQRR